MGRPKDNNPWLFTKNIKKEMPFNNIVGGILSALVHFLKKGFHLFFLMTWWISVYYSDHLKVCCFEVCSQGISSITFVNPWVHEAWVL